MIGAIKNNTFHRNDSKSTPNVSDVNIMQSETEFKTKLAELDKKKQALFEKIRSLKRKLQYKQYEHKALSPFLEKTKEVRIGPLRKQKRAVEFRIATQAYTPGIERELLKELKVIDKRLDEVQEVEKARRKKRFVEEDIAQAEKDILATENELKEVLEAIKKVHGDVKAIRSIMGSGVRMGGFSEDITLGDISIIEQEKK